jgi:hypothetical protein
VQGEAHLQASMMSPASYLSASWNTCTSSAGCEGHQRRVCLPPARAAPGGASSPASGGGAWPPHLQDGVGPYLCRSGVQQVQQEGLQLVVILNHSHLARQSGSGGALEGKGGHRAARQRRCGERGSRAGLAPLTSSSSHASSRARKKPHARRRMRRCTPMRRPSEVLSTRSQASLGE